MAPGPSFAESSSLPPSLRDLHKGWALLLYCARPRARPVPSPFGVPALALGDAAGTTAASRVAPLHSFTAHLRACASAGDELVPRPPSSAAWRPWFAQHSCLFCIIVRCPCLLQSFRHTTSSQCFPMRCPGHCVFRAQGLPAPWSVFSVRRRPCLWSGTAT